MAQQDQKQVTLTASGRVQGYIRDGIVEYLGIPYAKPPVGDLRFRRALPLEPWEGVYDAKEYGPAAVQFDEGQYKGSEDCLTVNVQRPVQGDNLPVLIYIHGGGYGTGAASDPLYNGRAFAEDGLLFFSFQYRMSVLGFYDFTSCPGCEDYESNCGLSDQIAAMTWIHENLTAFGGDAQHITICGESAGAASVINLMAAPKVRGFFQQAIVQSGLPHCVGGPNTSRIFVNGFLEGMGWHEEDLSRLKTADPFDLLKGCSFVSAVNQERYPGNLLPAPVVDDLLPEYPLDAITKGSAAGVRLIIGTNHDEGSMFVHPDATVFPNSWDMIRRMFAENGHADAFDAVRSYYETSSLSEGATPGELDPFIAFATDYAFRVPSILAAQAQSEYGRVWLYRFDLVTPFGAKSGMRASHAFELPAVFVNRDHPFTHMVYDGDEASLALLTEEMHGDWVRFAKEGEPDSANWPEYGGYQTYVRVFDRMSAAIKEDYTSLMTLWKNLRFYAD